MELFFGIISGLFILVVLVVAHELGHTIAALRSGVVVEEFGVGFPPSVWKKKLSNGVLLSLNWLPLGGFVKLQGEHDAASKKGDYGSASFIQKTKIMLAGVVTNWLLAALLLSGLAFTGMPQIIPKQFSISGDSVLVNQPVELISITKGYPAEKAGFVAGDQIISLAGETIKTTEDFIEVSKQNIGKQVKVVYLRDKKQQVVDMTLSNNTKGGIFGAGLGQRELRKSTWSAPIVGFGTTAQFTWMTLQGVTNLIGDTFSNFFLQFSPDKSVSSSASAGLSAAGDSVAGPIGILGTIFPAAQKAGLTQLVFLTAIVSVSLAVMNILPIPSLDGGRWFTMTAFKLFNKKLTKELEEKIQAVGFSILMGLVIVVTLVDVAKLF